MPHVVVGSEQFVRPVAEVAERYLGVRIIEAPDLETFDEDFEATLELMYPAVDYSELVPGAEFFIYEGPSIVGSGVVI